MHKKVEFDKIKDFILKTDWTFAKTMPDIPHYYVVRDSLSKSDKIIFDDFNIFIEKHGYTARFFSKKYTYYNIDKYKYWVIENILNRDIIKK